MFKLPGCKKTVLHAFFLSIVAIFHFNSVEIYERNLVGEILELDENA